MTDNRPLILISNDDGLHYPGIHTLISIARELGDVVVVAPEHHQSGMSSAITIITPLRAVKVSEEPGLTVWQVGGTPTDCMKLALDQLLGGRRPDLVLSGINHGYNAGISAIYSGTVGVVLEAVLRHLPAVAFSHGAITRDIDFAPCVPYIRRITAQALAHREALREVCLNVNFPREGSHYQGVKVTTTAMGHWEREYDHRVDPHGQDYYWLQGHYVSDNPDDTTTDFYWLERGWVTVTPTQVDLTAHHALPAIDALLKSGAIT
ncbi:MAG: 5'/3'-nucleotidase SurE [Muribaculaceae bacterium]|nr:5'/3'-nucleotidase SurE [Muribaculaceae bacterium]